MTQKWVKKNEKAEDASIITPRWQQTTVRRQFDILGITASKMTAEAWVRHCTVALLLPSEITWSASSNQSLRWPEETRQNGLIPSPLSRQPLQDQAVCSSAQSRGSRTGSRPQSRSRGRWRHLPDPRVSVCWPIGAVVSEPASSWSSCSGGDEAGRTRRPPSSSGHTRKRWLWNIQKRVRKLQQFTASPESPC